MKKIGFAGLTMLLFASLCVFGQQVGGQGTVPHVVLGGRLLENPQPVYPPLARQARIQGQVVFDVVIAADGSVKELQLVSGHPMLVQSATEAARQWKWEPFVVDGKPAKVETRVILNFSLENGNNATQQPEARAITDTHDSRTPLLANAQPAPRSSNATTELLLRDPFTSASVPKAPKSSAADIRNISSIVKTYTRSTDPVEVESSLKGHFVDDFPGEQTLFAVTQGDIKRSMAQGDWAFLVLYGGTTVRVIKSEVEGHLFSAIRLPGQTTDSIVLESSGVKRDEFRDYFRIISVRGLRFTIVADVGLVEYNNCPSEHPKGIVTDKLYAIPQNGKLTFRREHYISPCEREDETGAINVDATPRFLGTDNREADEVFYSLPQSTWDSFPSVWDNMPPSVRRGRN